MNEPYLSTPTTNFSEAFPDLATVDVRVIEYDDDIWRKEGRRCHFTLEAPPPEVARCSNSSCRDGGVNLGSVLREMCRERRLEAQIHQRCRGKERSGRSCIHGFKVEVKLTFASEP